MKFKNENGCEIRYMAVRKANAFKPYTMSVTSRSDIKAVMAAVNQGIDSHLEACYCPERGDKFEAGQRKVGERVVCLTLDCVVSSQSLPVLLRRLFESGNEDAERLASDMLLNIGFDESGKFVGREALGLE